MPRIVNSNYSSQIIHGEYYPHIDGIRALAVLPVVLFHVLAAICPGGFAGVDVFFVISGYLITGGIIRDLKKGRFTIRGFYHRRIRRILPAYFAMIAGVFTVGCAIYYALPLIYLGDTTIMGTLFSANIYFYLFSGDYFDPSIHNNPLLHLWSLSVEEQFYLFIPLFCATIWKFRPRLVFPLLALLTVVSLSGAIYAVMNGKQNSAFYLLHFRAWELLTGSLLAMLPNFINKAAGLSPFKSASSSLKRVDRIEDAQTIVETRDAMLSSLGILLVGLTYVGISSTTPFPGLTALPPVIGTALLIRFGQSGWVSRLLSSPLSIGLGKISYSLYLWHWPVIVFWKYVVYDQLHAYDYMGMFVLSLMLAYLSWRFVELPVRTSASLTIRRSFECALAGIFILVALGTACAFNEGWPGWIHVEANKRSSNEFPSRVLRMLVGFKVRLGGALGYKINDPFRLSFGASGDYSLGVSQKEPEVLLVGDSHAGHLQYGLDMLLHEKKHAGYSINRSSTDMFNLQRPESLHIFGKLGRMPNGSCVILAERYESYYRDQKELMFIRIADFASRIKAMKHTLYIVTDVPGFDYSPCDIAARMKIIAPRQLEPGWKNHQQTEAAYNRMQGEINRRLEDVCRQTGATLIPLHLALKQGDHYVAFDAQKDSYMPLYKDAHHLSMPGSLRAAQFIMPYVLP